MALRGLTHMAYLLQHLLSESAAKHPDKAALVFKDQTMTYAALEQESAALASGLSRHGVRRGDRVGIFMDRGIASIVGLFGILKAGAAYVPIDPMSPPNRLGYILKTCEIACLLTARDKLNTLEKVLPSDSAVRRLVVMDGADPGVKALGPASVLDGREMRSSLGGEAPAAHAVNLDLAYILFTSGSTGNPKGVMLSHLNALTFIDAAREFFRIRPEDRFSNICPLHFDMSVVDLFVALSAGATVVIIPETAAIFPVKLAETIATHRISVWNSVPSALSLLATYQSLDRHDLSSLRLILFAGELFPLKYLRRLQDALPGAWFCNMYGQTEANSSTYYWVDRLPPDATASLPIGKPMPNFDVFALDHDGNRITAPGVEGELYVRAATVARGYWGEPEKTAAAFVPNPLRPEAGERVYKTGDLVQLDADGNYVFLGRKDHMIKSRGYRIEIGEIETILCNHPDIQNAVVIPIPDELIGNRISALVVPSRAGTLTKDDVVKYCVASLPKYMVPEIVELREALPTTSSGKVDRKKLSDAARARPQPNTLDAGRGCA
ncbi:MAG: amino acid adenylation domain-containing protein [Nitrospirota bacterium]